ncbi:MAG: hypothetical protein ABI823_15740 [Bryobacteraceae bacterium]
MNILRLLPVVALLASACAAGRPALAEQSAKSAKKGPPKVTLGIYSCSYYEKDGDKKTVVGFEIGKENYYRHRDGSVGKYGYDPDTRQIAFHGGSLDKTLALFDTSQPKVDYIRLFNRKMTRTILDCQTEKH